MEIIKETRTIEEVKGYRAYDGTIFEDINECTKYEKTAEAVIKEKFKKLVIKELEGVEITNWGDIYPCSSVDEDWYYALVEIKNSDDLITANMYDRLCGHGCGNSYTEDMIGKKVIVSIGDEIYPKPNGEKLCAYDFSHVWGTIDECIERYANALRQLEEVGE